jgi:tetratricopeptide (TPR) repeat protein
MAHRDYLPHESFSFDAKKVDKTEEKATIDELLEEIRKLKWPYEDEFNKAYALEASGNLEQAIRAHEEILARDPKYFPSLFTLAKNHCDEGRSDLALDYCRRAEACDISPILGYEVRSVAFLSLKHDADTLFATARYDDALKRYDDAIEYFEKNIVGLKRVRMDTAIVNIIQYSHIYVKKVNARISKTTINEEDLLSADEDINTAIDLYAAVLDIIDDVDDGRPIFMKARYNTEFNLRSVRVYQQSLSSMLRKMSRQDRKAAEKKTALN